MPETVETKPETTPKKKSGLEMRVDALEIELSKFKAQMTEWERLYKLLLNDYQSRFSGVLIK